MNWPGLIAAAVVLAPGYSKLDFPAPVPGTYDLPVLWAAADADVLTSNDKAVRLHEFMGDKAVIMSFIYTSCGDVNGCPLANNCLNVPKQLSIGCRRALIIRALGSARRSKPINVKLFGFLSIKCGAPDRYCRVRSMLLPQTVATPMILPAEG